MGQGALAFTCGNEMCSWNWKKVTIIYEEDTDSTFSRIIPVLLQSLQQVGAEISQLVEVTNVEFLWFIHL